MAWIMFWINLFIFVILYFFVNWRLNKIAEEVNSIVKSNNLIKEERKLKIITILLFVLFFILSSIYIFIYF